MGGTVAEAQREKKIPRIGYLTVRAGPSDRDEAFRQGLRDLGYIEGQNIIVERRFANGTDRLVAMAAELARLNLERCGRGHASGPGDQKRDGDGPHRHGGGSGSGREWTGCELGPAGRGTSRGCPSSFRSLRESDWSCYGGGPPRVTPRGLPPCAAYVQDGNRRTGFL